MKPPKPQVQTPTLMNSSEESSGTCFVTSRRVPSKKQKPNDALHHPKAITLSKSNRTLVFDQLGVKAKGKANAPKCFGSNLESLGTSLQFNLRLQT